MKNIITIAILGISLSVAAQDLPYMDGRINYEKKGDYHYDGQAYAKALEAYEQALKKGPKDSTLIHLKQANVHRMLDNNEAAEEYYRLAFKEDPSKEDVVNLAEVLAKNGKYEEAKSWLDYAGEDASKLALVQRRKEGFAEVSSFYGDSLAYTVTEVGFNSPQADFSPLITAKGLIFVSGRKEGGMFTFLDKHDEAGFLNLYRVKEGVPVAMKDLNTLLNQGPVALMPDGRLMVTSNHAKSSKNADRNKETSLKLELFELKDGKWVLSAAFPYNDRSYSVGHPAYDPKRNCLYFASNMAGGYGGVDLYRSEYKDGEWQRPENLGQVLNTEGDELFPFYDAANDLLYYSSNGYAGLGGLDFYKVDMANPQRVVNLGYPPNSEGDDFGIALDAHGKNGFISSNRKGGTGKDDLYELKIHRVQITARLKDGETGKMLKGNLKVIDKKSGEAIPFEMDGDQIAFEGFAGREYEIIGDTEGYQPGKMLVAASPESENMLIDVVVKPKVVEALVQFDVLNLSDTTYYALYESGLTEVSGPTGGFVIANVFFGFDRYDLGGEVGKLDELASLMNAQQNLTLVVKGYADSQGPAIYNQRLATKRVETVAAYLFNKGVAANRVQVIGIGERQPAHDGKEGVDWEAVHAKSRRVEFFFETSLNSLNNTFSHFGD